MREDVKRTKITREVAKRILEKAKERFSWDYENKSGVYKGSEEDHKDSLDDFIISTLGQDLLDIDGYEDLPSINLIFENLQTTYTVFTMFECGCNEHDNQFLDMLEKDLVSLVESKEVAA